MEPKLSDILWTMYEDEFGAFLDAEIELLEVKLRALKKIRQKFKEGLKDANRGKDTGPDES